jgi:hypothetical protein
MVTFVIRIQNILMQSIWVVPWVLPLNVSGMKAIPIAGLATLLNWEVMIPVSYLIST